MLLLFVQVLSGALCLYLIKRRFVHKSAFANIPGPPRKLWWKGYFDQLFDANGWNFRIVEKYGSVVKLPMLFGDEELYITDPLALHHIIVKDQYIYEETSVFITTNVLTFGMGLLSTLGDHHRKQRKMLNPLFSLKHMRDLLPIFYPITYDLRDVLVEQVRNGVRQIDVLHWLSRAALEYIGQAGFGYKFNALHDEESSKYGEYVNKIAPILFKTAFLRRFVPWFTRMGTPAFWRTVLENIPSKLVKECIEVVDVLESRSKVIYEKSKKAMENGDEATYEKIGRGKDILSVLLRANTTAKESDRLPEEEIIGQLNTFILAGQDTTSHALTRALHLLSLNIDVQDRLRDEIITARKEREGTDFDYDTLMGLPYLDAVCRETLRVFPPLAMIARTARKDVVLPLAWPILGVDGKTEVNEVPIKANTNVIVSIIGANRSKKIWGDDAEEWKPERWLEPLPESVAKAHMPGVYASMMTFIGGGRACIGFKFAEMEIKLVLATLLETFKFEAGPEAEWRMTGITRPVLKNSSDKAAKLLLKTTLVKD